MAATIKIKRSTSDAVPSGLSQGELAYSGALSSGVDANAGKLYIGSPGTTASLVIGGTFYTNLLSATNGTASASKAVLLDASAGVSGLGTVGASTFTGTIVNGGNLRMAGNTLSSTNANGNVNINATGTGSILVYGGDAEQWSLPRAKGTDTWVLTSNGSGAATWKQPVSVMTFDNGAGSTSSVNLLTQTFTLFGGNGVDVNVSGQSATISISSGEGVVTVDGVQTLYNKSLADTSTQFVNGTSAAKLSVAGVSPGTTVTLTVQNQSGTVALLQNTLNQFANTTAAQLQGVISGTTGTGDLVFATSPRLITPDLGAATATTINGVTVTTASGAVLTLAANKTLTVSNTLNLSGTDSANVNFGAGSTGTVAYSTSKLSFFSPTSSAELAGVISDETGTGSLVFANSPTLVTPNIGAATATSVNGLTITSSTGTLNIANGSTLTSNGNLTFNSSGNPSTVNFGAGSTGTVAYSTDKLSFFSATTSAELAGVITDETGTGSLVFSNNATLVAPTLGEATATTINKVIITQPANTATLTLASGSTFATSGGFSTTLTSTGATSVTLPTSGTLSTLSNVETLTNKTISTGSTYQGNIIAIAYGGTGSDNGSITGSGALTFTAGGANNNVTLAPTGTGVVDVSSKKISNLATPTLATDAATKAYVDSQSQGLDAKGSCRVASTGNLTLSGTQTIDTISVAVGERVLVKDQTLPAENGIWVVSASTWTRADDMSEGNEFPGAFTFVEEGATWQDTGWVCTTNAPVTVGTTPITWVQFSSAGVITAGAGLTKTGNTLSVNVDTSTIEIVGGGNGTLQIKDKGVTYAKIQDVDGLSVIGRAGNTSGTTAAISAGADFNILRRSGNSIAFGSIDLSQAGAVGSSVLGTQNGGTGLATYTAGDLVYASGTQTLATITATATGFVLASGGTGAAPAYSKVGLTTHITGTLAVANGGSGATSFTATQLLVGNGTNPFATSANLTFAAAGTTGGNELTVGAMKIATTNTNDVIITATQTNGNIVLAPNGTGIVDIGGPNSGSSSLGTTGNENLNITSGGSLNLTAGTTMTLTTTASDIIMALPNTSTYKVTVTGPSTDNYATGLADNDLVSAYWVTNYATIDGGTY